MAVCAACTASRQDPAQAAAAVADAVELAGSAVETTSLTLALLASDDLTGPVADTTISDQIGELSDASYALVTLVPPDDTSSALRSQSLTALAAATDAVVTARAWVARGAGGNLGPAGDVPTDPRDVAGGLDDAADRLEDVLTTAGR